MEVSKVMASGALAANGKSAANIIAVASGKGGVGKTWLSVSLSHALANKGQSTMLFDGDLGLANVDIQLDLAPERDLGGVIAGRYGLEAAKVSYATGGFDVIAGRSGSGNLANLPGNRLGGLISDLVALSSGYNHVVLDLGAGIERTVRQFAALAGTCLVVTNDEPTSLTDAYAFIKLTTRQFPGMDLRVVVNMAETINEGQRTYGTIRKACESFLKITPPLAGVIRRDSSVKESIRHQTPLLTRYPNSKAAEDIQALARRLTGGP